MKENKVVYIPRDNKPVTFTVENTWVNLKWIEEHAIWIDPDTGEILTEEKSK